jgi:23S rRNA (adenine2503-C2)-methyltransferase
MLFSWNGEPLMNYNNMMKAIDMITSPEGLGMSLNESWFPGVPKNDKKMADDDVKFKLAVSILVLMKSVNHAFSAKFPLADLRESLEYWYKDQSKISYEYVV